MSLPAERPERIYLVGDGHGDLPWYEGNIANATSRGIQQMVQLGDFGLWPDLDVLHATGQMTLDNGFLDGLEAALAAAGRHLLFIKGNHDWPHPIIDSTEADANGIRQVRPHLQFAEQGAGWVWSGVRFGVLGGAVSPDRESRQRPGGIWFEQPVSAIPFCEGRAKRTGFVGC